MIGCFNFDLIPFFSPSLAAINQAKHCSDAGAVGVVIVNNLDENGFEQDMAIMTGDHSEIQQLGE